MTYARDRRWVADDRIGWRILLTARVDRAAGEPSPESLGAALEALYDEQGWGDAPPLEAGPSLRVVQSALVHPDPAPLRVGLHADALILSAHHGAADGLALLTVLARLLPGPVNTSVRGVDDRPQESGLAGAVARRLVEVVTRPPARISTPGGAADSSDDALVAREVPGRYRSADLVHAAARGVVAHEEARGGTARRVAVAVGAGRTGHAGAIGDHSALIRLRDVERLDRSAVAALLATAPLQTPPGAAAVRPWTPVIECALGVGLRVLAPRLGSTLLVSHLGEVTAPAVRHLAFHPVTAGGTGVSLGAVSLAGRDTTVLTLRARAASWTDNGLEQLLEAVVSLLGEESGGAGVRP